MREVHAKLIEFLDSVVLPEKGTVLFSYSSRDDRVVTFCVRYDPNDYKYLDLFCMLAATCEKHYVYPSEVSNYLNERMQVRNRVLGR